MGDSTLSTLLIVVIFNVETGSEVETRRDFQDEPSCHAAALQAFQAVDENVEIRPMEVPAGQEMIQGTMIGYGASGGEIGMYACNVLRATVPRQDG